MRLFARRAPFDRKRLLFEAERAVQKGRTRRAISFYRRLLAAERNNPELHARIAPLLAKAGECFDAWQSYRHAGQVLVHNKQPAQALALYRHATRALPRQVEAWQTLARLQLAGGRRQDARETLLAGRRQLGARRTRAEAICLLREACSLEPWHPDTLLDLASLLARSGQAPEALWLLDGLATRTTEPTLQRRIRAAQWRTQPSLEHGWRWLRACLAWRRTGAGALRSRGAP